MSDRDTLAELIHAAICEDSWEHECLAWDGKCIRAAEQQLAAGVRPPAREITTAAELDALPIGSVISDGADQVLRRVVVFAGQPPGWEVTGDERPVEEVRLPATVLREPTEETSRG